jgi:hypothetical protein
MDLPVTVAIMFECTMKEFHFSWETTLVTNDTSSVYQGQQHRMLIGWVVVQLSIQKEADMSGFFVHSVHQGAIRFSVYVNVQEG